MTNQRNAFRMVELVQTSGVKFGTSGARGLVEQLTPQVCYAYAQAFWTAVGGGKRAIIGHDLRPSSPNISRACIKALQDLGVETVYVGALPTPAIAYYAQEIQAPALVITGSHIPFDRNGIKFYRAEGEITKNDEQAILSASVQLPGELVVENLPLPSLAAREAYISRYVDFFGSDCLVGKRIAIYQHSSVARDLLVDLFVELGAETIALGYTDSFVPIDTEAVRPDDIERAAKWAQEHDFDAIVSTDGDADRPLIGDERGGWLRGDIVGILCAEFLKANVVVTPISSNTAVEKSQIFRHVIRTRIGSPYVIEAMQGQVGNVVGYEANGGFLLGSDISNGAGTLRALPTRDAVLPIIATMCLSIERNQPLSRLAQHLPQRFSHSDRIQSFATERSSELLARLQRDESVMAQLLAPESGAVANIDTTDGLRVTFESGDIVHLRPSGNAPELRCYAEASSEWQASLLCDECLKRCHQIRHD